ncbi:MAG: Uma2 family endonuclease [Anaerolineae bacterium]|nr:Uma2 family endonuclease [Anaerolineae bacterium]
MLQAQLITAQEFDRVAALPENRDRRLELIAGEIHEAASNHYASRIAAAIGAELRGFVKRGRLGGVTGADGGYIVAGERYIPDVAFISAARQPEGSREAYNPLPPDLAVEVLSPGDEQADIRRKLTNYLYAGTTVWVIDPEARTAEVHSPGQPLQVIREGGVLNGDPILPGFSLPLADIFDV